MVATLLSLKFHLVVADMKRSVARLVVWILSALFFLFYVGLALVGLGFASLGIKGNESFASVITILAGSTVVMGWTLLPLFFYGADQTLDPARFTLFPLTGRKLAIGLLLAGVIGLPGLATLLMSLGTSLPWRGSAPVFLLGLLGGFLGFIVTQIGCRVVSTALSGVLSTRKAKDMTGLISLIAILLLSMSSYALSFGMAFLSSGNDFGRAMLVAKTASAVLAWTPLGSAWAIVGAAGQGQWLFALAYLVLTLVYVVLGVLLYARVLDKALVTPAQAMSSTAVGKSDLIAKVSGWVGARGAMVPVAAIAARALRYWRRDPRYMGQIPAILLMPFMFGVLSWSSGNYSDASADAAQVAMYAEPMLAFGLVFAALMAGYCLSYDVANDSTAWWIHLASGVKGWQDRLGRILGQMVWALPLLIILGVAVPVLRSGGSGIAATIGSMLTAYFCGLSLASIFSALVIYPVPLPGESPLKMRTGMMGSQILSQFGSLFAAVLLAAPVSISAFLASESQGWLILLVGLIWGTIVLVAGVIIGGKILDARGPAVLATLVKNDSRERS
jgi:ABC-2 type transport system permease protein